MQRTDLAGLIARYDVFWLDVYGVLVQTTGALPGAARFLRRLRDAGKSYLLVSNDASRSPETSLQRYGGFGLDITLEQILTSGMLLREHYASAGLVGAPTIVLGTDDSARYVTEAGGRVVAASDEAAEVVVVADDDGYPLLETANDALTVILRRLDAGRRTHLVLPNPDMIFPAGDRAYGFTAGAIAAMFEATLRLRDPRGGLTFARLGKPNTPIFAAALQRSPVTDKQRIVMVGDQVVTDIAGARAFGVDAAFVESGIGRVTDVDLHGVRPTWLLAGLDAS
jgi:HAD superfamily hydrolase (TIGR01459 family)